jgi:DNA-binding CsgD family transcriptional regulator
VLAHLAAGRTNRQIAETLFISPRTAGVHVSRILAKLGVTTRGEAAATGRLAGIVDEDEIVRRLGRPR